MATFNISGNHFYDDAQMFGQYNEYNMNWDSLETELNEIKSKLDDTPSLKQAIAELESVVRHREKRKIGQTVAKYAAAFSTTTFANLASEGLKAFVMTFMG